MKTLILAAAIAAALAGAARAEPTPAPAVAISHADLDLSSPSQAREMLRRVEAAAVAVCRDARAAGRAGAAPARTQARCRDVVVRDTVRRLDAPAVRQAFLKPAAPASMLADAR